MALQPPPAVTSQPAAAPPKPQRSGCLGCSFGCGGCLLVVVLIFLLIAGGGYYFFVVQASAAISAPASLVVINQPISVNGNPGTPGESLNAGDSVSAGTGGHGSIAFPDGSYMRLSPGTTVRITGVQLQRNGNVAAISVAQKVGRTLTNVQHLASGASFKIDGHSVSAEVRGTQFEVIVNSNGTNVIRVFAGTVKVSGGGKSVNVGPGQQVTVAADGTLGPVTPIPRDPQDPFPQAAACQSAVSSPTTQSGTNQTTTGDSLATGQTAEVDYNSPGGAVTAAMCYPGSTMSLTLVDPNGGRHPVGTGSPARATISGPPGIWKAIVHGDNVPGGEAWAVSFATDAPCSADNVDTGSVVRVALSSSQIATDLAESGTNGVTIYVDGTSPNAARIVYYSTVGGLPISWIIDFYAATPDLGAVITKATVHDIDVKTEIISTFGSFYGHSITSLPSGFVVDRVYSCATAASDNLMVVEGHR